MFAVTAFSTHTNLCLGAFSLSSALRWYELINPSGPSLPAAQWFTQQSGTSAVRTQSKASLARARARVSIDSRDLLNLLHNKAESTLPFPARGPGEALLKVTWTENTQGRSATSGQGTRWGSETCKEWRDLATTMPVPRLRSEVERSLGYFLRQWTFKTWNEHKGHYRSEALVNKEQDLFVTN